MKLAYDAGSCCLPGASRLQIRKRFESIGYKPRPIGETTDIIEPIRSLEGFSFRDPFLEVKYGADGKYSGHSLKSSAALP